MKFQPPDNISIEVDMKPFSSGLRTVKLEGASHGVVAALRAIMEQGSGVSARDADLRHARRHRRQGWHHLSVDSPQRPVDGRKVSHTNAYRFGMRALMELGVELVGEPLVKDDED